jgi:hypothetical protein
MSSSCLVTLFSAKCIIVLSNTKITYNMTANINVEEVLSKLDIVEKVSLLTGNCSL